jgi:uncharacterized protein
MADASHPPVEPKPDAATRLKNIFWSAASQLALHGICPWDLEEHWLHIHRRAMSLPGLGKGLCGARVVHLSDIHCSPLLRQRHLACIVERVNRLDPDFVVITGDFISSSTRYYIRQAGQTLGRLRPRIAALAVLGNHDYGLYHPTQPIIRGLAEFLTSQLEAGGIRVLTNERTTFRRKGATLHFAGIGEFWTPHYRPKRVLGSIPGGEPTVALVHNPDAAPYLADLGAHYVLAGHTHGRGTPDTRLHNLFFPVDHKQFVVGHYDLGRGRGLYVNRGIGPSRRDATSLPEISLFTLRNAARTDPWAKPLFRHQSLQARWSVHASLPALA